jgi:hypothetical protein
VAITLLAVFNWLVVSVFKDFLLTAALMPSPVTKEVSDIGKGWTLKDNRVLMFLVCCQPC